MIFGLSKGLNRRGQSVANDLNPEALFSGIVCAIVVNRDTTIPETTSLAPADRSEDFDTVPETTSLAPATRSEDFDTVPETNSQAPATRSEDFDTVAETIDDNCNGEIE